MNMMRRYRGWIRTTVTAGVLMSGLATGVLTIGVLTGVVPDTIFGIRELVAVAIRSFVCGAAAGGLFGWFVTRSAQRESVATLSTWRVSSWGGLATGSAFALAALAAPVVIPLGVAAAAIGSGIIGGGVLSAGLLRLARRAEIQLENPGQNAKHLLP